jgi:hypothetical protein
VSSNGQGPVACQNSKCTLNVARKRESLYCAWPVPFSSLIDSAAFDDNFMATLAVNYPVQIFWPLLCFAHSAANYTPTLNLQFC